MSLKDYDYSWVPQGYELFVTLKDGYADFRESWPPVVLVHLKGTPNISGSVLVRNSSGEAIDSTNQITDSRLTEAFNELKAIYEEAKTVDRYLGSHPKPLNH